MVLLSKSARISRGGLASRVGRTQHPLTAEAGPNHRADEDDDDEDDLQYVFSVSKPLLCVCVCVCVLCAVRYRIGYYLPWEKES